MKVSLKANLGKEADIELSVEGSPQEMEQVIAEPLKAIGTSTIPMVLENLLKNHQSGNDLREKLTKEDKRLEDSLPRMKHRIKENEEIIREMSNNGIQTHESKKFENYCNILESLENEYRSILSRRKLIKWALSEPDKN